MGKGLELHYTSEYEVLLKGKLSLQSSIPDTILLPQQKAINQHVISR